MASYLINGMFDSCKDSSESDNHPDQTVDELFLMDSFDLLVPTNLATEGMVYPPKELSTYETQIWSPHRASAPDIPLFSL